MTYRTTCATDGVWEFDEFGKQRKGYVVKVGESPDGGKTTRFPWRLSGGTLWLHPPATPEELNRVKGLGRCLVLELNRRDGVMFGSASVRLFTSATPAELKAMFPDGKHR